MVNKSVLSFSWLGLSLATLTILNVAQAEQKSASLAIVSPEQCVELVKECFAYSNSEQANCFFAAGKHAFCDNTDLGRLSLRRWSMSPNHNADFDTAPAFLGPKLVDQQCLSNFDSQWSGALIQGTLSTEAMRQLTVKLESCQREVSNDLSRP